MAIMTYRDMVVDILNDMDSDPLFTVAGGGQITSTEESRQVVQIIKTSYFEIIDSREWPFLNNLFQLTPLGIGNPTEMLLGTDVSKVKYVKYNTSSTATNTFRLMNYLQPQRFMNLVDARDNQAANVSIFDDVSGIPINVITDAPPTYYTLLEDNRVLFDAYDNAIDTVSLLANKTQCFGMLYPTVTETDAFIFNLPVNMFTYLLEEAKSTAFMALKQTTNPKADFKSTAAKAILKEDSWKFRKNHPIADRGLDVLASQSTQQTQRTR